MRSDLKLTVLLLCKKIKWIILSILVCLLIAGAIYEGVFIHRQQGSGYEAYAKYYITFEEMEDKSYFDYYYNGATWDELLHSDLILGYAMDSYFASPDTPAPLLDRDFVYDRVSADLYADVRVLTTTVKGESIEQTQMLLEGIEDAVLHFAANGAEKIEKITVIEEKAPARVLYDNNLWRALLLGFFVGAFLSIWFFCLQISAQGAIYLPSEFEEVYGIPLAGMMLPGEKEELLMELLSADKKEDKALSDPLNLHRELRLNLSFRMRKGDVNAVSMDELLSMNEDLYGELRALDGIILLFPQGPANAGKLSRVMGTLACHKIPVLAGVMTQADHKLLVTYYLGKEAAKGNPDNKNSQDGEDEA